MTRLAALVRSRKVWSKPSEGPQFRVKVERSATLMGASQHNPPDVRIMKTAKHSPGRVIKGISILLLAVAAQFPLGAQTVERRAVELTFLKANPGLREQLKSFIVLNWFAMDKIAKEQGLMSAFTVMDTGTDEGPWNVVVSVTYRDERGYDGIAEAFEWIRRAHTPVRVEGKSLRDLGSVVESKRVFENPAHASR